MNTEGLESLAARLSSGFQFFKPSRVWSSVSPTIMTAAAASSSVGFASDNLSTTSLLTEAGNLLISSATKDSIVSAATVTAVKSSVVNSSSPAISQLARIMRSLASVIMKQTSEVDIPDRRLSTFVAYLTSPFALLCMFMAIVLNRTIVFASVRRPQTLPLSTRILIRSAGIFQLARAIIPILTALKCYSPTLAQFIPKAFDVDFAAGEKCPGPDILWVLYKAFCLGHFVETLSCALEGRIPSADTGMTSFEYSLAFQEAQSAQRPSVEVLVISLIWAVNYLTFLLISILNLQNYRLIPSTFFGLISLGYFAASTYYGRAQFFPTVWVIGFAPHLGVLYVIVLCGCIYGIAAIFAGGTSNLQSSLRPITISLSEDFYSALLKLGILVLTSASDATYTAEGPPLAVPDATWVEALEFNKHAGFEYINEIPQDDERVVGGLAKRISFNSEPNAVYNTTAYTNSFSLQVQPRTRKRRRHSGRRLSSSFDHNNSLDKRSGYGSNNMRIGSSVGPGRAGNRKRRFGRIMLIYRIRMAYSLLISCIKLGVIITQKILNNIFRRDVIQEGSWARSGTEQHGHQIDTRNVSNKIISDDEYYSLFLQGDSLPEDDPSGDFEPSDDEADEVELDDGNESEASTALVPAYQGSITSELYPELGASDISLSSLLLPQTPEERHLSRVMTAHLSANEVVTRGKMRLYEEQLREYDEARGLGYDYDSDDGDDDETALLISFINERRQQKAPNSNSNNLHAHDLEDFTYQPSLCVVCHTNQRNVVLWPCRCLAVCEECRISLSIRNFKGCVCCRREVFSFSRLYVP
ncbi:hypothetical protein V1514DRAFT_328369 [Lipomyces japonicus]|uniref:uncharacterized protein n=1 Tax=Lipomyces japonicus TaxID=56871 RepID=UPI0034CFB620